MRQLLFVVVIIFGYYGCQIYKEKNTPLFTQGDQPIVIASPNPPQPTYAWISHNIFDRDKGCMKCHGVGNIPDTHPLEPYEALLDPNRYIVIPGDPDNSTLYKVLIMDKPQGNVFNMPPKWDKDPVPLSDDEKNAVKLWIEQGAQNN